MAEQRIALVTGANRGIGFEVCRQLAHRDFIVLLSARNAKKAEAGAKQLANGGLMKPIALDVADATSMEEKYTSLKEVRSRL